MAAGPVGPEYMAFRSPDLEGKEKTGLFQGDPHGHVEDHGHEGGDHGVDQGDAEVDGEADLCRGLAQDQDLVEVADGGIHQGVEDHAGQNGGSDPP